MNNYFRKIACGTLVFLLLNSCNKPVKYDLIIQDTTDMNGLVDFRREYMVPDYKYDENSDQQMDAFANKVADSLKNKSYMHIYLRFYLPSAKTDLKALKEEKIEIGDTGEIPIAMYIWNKDKFLVKLHDKKKSQSVPDKNAPIVTPEE